MSARDVVAGSVVMVQATPETVEMGINCLYGQVERTSRAYAWVLVDGARYRLFYNEFRPVMS